MSSNQMPAPGKIKLIKFPPPGQVFSRFLWMAEVAQDVDYMWVIFYDNSTNSCAHWQIFIVNKRTDTWIYNLCDTGTSESEQFDSLLS